MAFTERINPRTGEKEFKCRYYFITDGKRHDSQTGWFPTKEAAKKEAEQLKVEKEKASINKELQRRDKKLKTAFEEFIKYYETRAHRKTTDLTSSDDSTYRRAKTINKLYFPTKISNTKIKDIDEKIFKKWLNHLVEEDFSGTYIRSLKTTLQKFNKWLSNNGYYIDDSLEDKIAFSLSKVSLPPKKYKNRQDLKERNILDIMDLIKIRDYFFKKGLGTFKNFYFYTLFEVLFFTGMRVEELCGLQWKNINLDSTVRTIDIVNAISERELAENVYERIKQNIYHTKNKSSIREIPIFDYYYELLIDYRDSFKYEYNLSEKDIDECFVFPKLRFHNPKQYFDSGRINSVLQEAIKATNTNKSDLQMFRHSCATFLILPSPFGLGFSEEEVIDYFGHVDTQMLRDIYAQINKDEKSKRMRTTFKKYFTPDVSEESQQQNNYREYFIDMLKDNRDDAFQRRKERIFKQIQNAINKKQKTYYYLSKDDKIIDAFIEKFSLESNKIKFVQE